MKQWVVKRWEFFSLITGNLFYYAVMFGKETIDATTRVTVFYPLLGVSVIGMVTFSLLRHPWTTTVRTGNEQ